jgi:hypothetical protein
MMFCLGATIRHRIGDLCKMRHLAAKSADSMLLNLYHSVSWTGLDRKKITLKRLNILHRYMYSCVHAKAMPRWEEVLH